MSPAFGNCADCACWIGEPVALPIMEGEGWRRCHRRAPQPGHYAIGRWPHTIAEDGCFDFVRKDDEA